jgi:hypothetical protein
VSRRSFTRRPPGDLREAADQLAVAADQALPSRLQRHGDDAEHQQCADHAQRHDQAQRNAETRHLGIDEDHRAGDERRDSADAEHAEAWQERFGDHESDAEQDQRHAGVVHW